MSLAIFKRNTFQPSPEDLENERMIADIFDLIRRTKSRLIQRRLWCIYRHYHKKRSPGMVAHMEKKMGIYRG